MKQYITFGIVALLLIGGGIGYQFWLDSDRYTASQCIDFYRQYFRDPGSVEYFSHQISPSEIVVTVRATNTFGAYVASQIVCDLYSSGSVDSMQTSVKHLRDFLERG